MKYYLITGGCGFIGQQLARELQKSRCHIDLIDLPKKKNNFIQRKFSEITFEISIFSFVKV